MTCMTNSRQIWDISAPVHEATPAYPGDTPYRQSWKLRIAPRCPVNLSTVEMSPHVGTHADAPLHYDDGGLSMGEVSLEPYLGRCRVIHAIGCGPLVQWEHIAHAISADLPPRVLVRTYSQVPRQWDEHLSGYAPQTIEALARHGVQLIGIDTPSVDPVGTAGLDSHMQVRRHGMRILENLVLDEVAEGDYELIALPLKWTQAEASPVRAVLRSL